MAAAVLSMVASTASVAAAAGPDAPAPDVSAPEPGPDAPFTETTWPLLDEGETSRDLQGLAPTLGLQIVVPPGTRPAGDAILEIAYRAPSALADSAIAVAVNGRNVDVVALAPGSNTLSLAIPADRLQTGANSIEIEASIRLTFDEDCPDPRHVARQLSIDPASVLRLPLVADQELRLVDLPAVLIPAGPTKGHVTIVLGDPDVGVLTAAGVVTGLLRENGDDTVAVVVQTDTTPAPAGPSVILDVDAGDGTAEGGAAAIGRDAAGHPQLTISGTTSDEVLAAARLLADPARRALIAGAATDVEPLMSVEEPARERRVTLSSLGYDDRTMSGPGEAGLIYQFDVPTAERPSRVDVEVRAALEAATDDRNVGLIVEFNSVDVGTLSFDDTGRLDSEISIPASAVRSGTNFLRFHADFGSTPTSCVRGRPGNDSITVRAESQVDLGDVDGLTRLDLDDLPYIFRSAQDSDDLVVVLPASPTDEDRAIAVELSALFAARSRSARIVTAEQAVDGDLVDGSVHLVLLGEVGRQPLLDALVLPIPAGDGGGWATNPQVGSAAQVADGAVELFRNQSNPDRIVLAVTGVTAPGALQAARAVLDRDLRREMFQQVALIAPDGVTITQVAAVVPIAAAPTDSPPTTAPAVPVPPVPASTLPPVAKSSGFPKLGAAGVAVLFALGGAVFLVVRMRRRAAA